MILEEAVKGPKAVKGPQNFFHLQRNGETLESHQQGLQILLQ